MKTRCPIGFAVVIALVGCGDDQDPEGAAELFDRIQAEDYQSWMRAPGYETQKFSGTHGDAVNIFINPTLDDVLSSGEPINAWPLGSLIVKDGYGDGELEEIAAMEKRDDGWFWVEWTDISGEDAKYSGKPDVCTDCHSAGDDYVRAFGFP
jgi:hypothetical protein